MVGLRTFDREKKISIYYVPYEEVVSLAEDILGRIDLRRYGIFLGVANGGLGFLQLGYDRAKGAGAAGVPRLAHVSKYDPVTGAKGKPRVLYLPDEVADRQVLVFEDVTDDGDSLGVLDAALRAKGARPEYAALYEKGGSGFSLDYAGAVVPRTVLGEDRTRYSNWIHFPWEAGWKGSDSP